MHKTPVLVVLFLVKATCPGHRLGGFAAGDSFMLIGSCTACIRSCL
jgi:hypothetical protein